jgi:hypothetical protein
VVDAQAGYRNGYSTPWLTMSSGTITLKRPSVRGLAERFASRVLPLFTRRTKELGALLPCGVFLETGHRLSKASIQRLVYNTY